MAAYEYTATDQNGNKISGIYDGIDSVAALRRDLAKMGDTLLKARRKKTTVSKRARIKPDEIVTFTYKLAEMCSAGLPIIRCIETLEEQTPNRSFTRILSDIRQSVATGSSLRDAFGKHGSIFSNFFLGMLEAGESSGRLSETLQASAIYLEKQADFRHKVKSAFAYPIIVGIMCFLVVAFLVIFVVPVFSKMYRQMHVPLPGPTQALITLSNTVRSGWWAIPLIVIGTSLLLKLLWKKANLKTRWDSFKLSMPVLAKFYRLVVASGFIRTFAMLASAGVSLVKALEVAGAVVDNAKITEITGQLQKSIQKGNTVTDSLKNSGVFPMVIIQLAASGEESGTLSDMLNKGADFLDKDINRMLKALLVKIEPAMTIILGLIVGFILMSVYLPMFDYMSHIE
jgi:type IV pilus assembly protein PilC